MRDPSVYNVLADFDEKFLIKGLKVDLTNVLSWSIFDDDIFILHVPGRCYGAL